MTVKEFVDIVNYQLIDEEFKMPNECYVIYARHHNKETEEFEGVCIISCVDTEEKAQNYLDRMTNEYNAQYVNEAAILIDDEKFPFLEFVTYQDVINDFDGGI